MTVVTDNVRGSGGDGAVYKLVIVGVGRDEVETISRADVLNVRRVVYGIYDVSSEFSAACHEHDDLLVFK